MPVAAPDPVDEREQGRRPVVRRTLETQDLALSRRGLPDQLLEQSRLADAGLSQDEDRAPAPIESHPPGLQEKVELRLTAHEGREPVADPGFEPALTANIGDGPELDRCRNPFQFAHTERLEVEPIADQLPRARRDHEAPASANARARAARLGVSPTTPSRCARASLFVSPTITRPVGDTGAARERLGADRQDRDRRDELERASNGPFQRRLRGRSANRSK